MHRSITRRVAPLKTFLAIMIALSLSSGLALAQESAATAGHQVKNSSQQKPKPAKKRSSANEAIEEVYVLHAGNNQASAATKLDLNVKSTPQSISVVDRQQIEALGVTNLGQLLLQTTGVILTGDNSERTNFSVRGFNLGDGWNSNLLQYDGIPINASNVAASKPDMALVESVEVLRGAAGLM